MHKNSPIVPENSVTVSAHYWKAPFLLIYSTYVAYLALSYLLLA